jgi:intracellular septation protein
MAVGLAWALWGMRKNVLQTLLGSQLDLPAQVWQRLNVAWVVYSTFMAALNAFVVLNYSTEDWVNFKLWGYLLPLTFIIGQGIYIAPFLKAAEGKTDGDQP